jgi:hypothetical protein
MTHAIESTAHAELDNEPPDDYMIGAPRPLAEPWETLPRRPEPISSEDLVVQVQAMSHDQLLQLAAFMCGYAPKGVSTYLRAWR